MDTQKIGKFIAACRKEKGMTQVQLGEQLGVTAKTISRWENGNYMPDLSLLMPLSEILGVSLNELLSGERIVQEDIQQKELLEKTESSISGALKYSAEQIKMGKRKIFATMFSVLIVVGIFFATIFTAFHKIYFSEISYHEEDVSQWQSFFPNHSAYELAMGDAGEPVFKDTKAALNKVKIDSSDAIKEIQEVYDLLPFEKYTYKSYKLAVGRANLLFKADARVMEQRDLLLHFLDIYENSFEWEMNLSKDTTETMEGIQESTEDQINVIDNSHADYQVTTYEKNIDMTGDGVLDKVTFVMNVTEDYKDVTDTYELLRLPFVGHVQVYDGASGMQIYQSSNISGDRIGNGQFSLVSDENGNYLLVSKMNILYKY